MNIESVTEVKIDARQNAIDLTWGIPTNQEHMTNASHGVIEVRLYCNPFPDFGVPQLKNATFTNRQHTNEISGQLSFFEVLSIGIVKGNTRSAFRSGLTTLDLVGKYLPIYIELDAEDVPSGTLGVYPSVEFPIATTNWLDVEREIRVVFVFHGVRPLESPRIYESIMLHRPNSGTPAKVNAPPLVQNLPTLTSIFVGREADFQLLVQRMKNQISRQAIVFGWPGVGKTSFITKLAKQRAVEALFPDGILWAFVGESPNHLQILAEWARLLRIPDLHQTSLSVAKIQIRETLKNKKVLLIIDDVWTEESVVPLQVAGDACFTIITTRFQKVAELLSSIPDERYRLGVLPLATAKILLKYIAPKFMAELPNDAEQWLRDIETLPLSILVGGRLFERDMIWGASYVKERIKQLKLLTAKLTTKEKLDINPEMGKLPTIKVLLDQSTRYLDKEMHLYYTLLGILAPKPATFDLETIQILWDEDNPRPYILQLIDYGLLEPTETGRFWMHALLVEHARSFFKDS